MGRPVLLVGIAMLALATAGCGGAFSGGGTAARDAATPPAAQKNVAPQQEKAPQNAQSVQQERQLVRTANVDLRADDVLKAIGEVKERARAVGGFAGQESSTKRSGSVTVRVPSSALDRLVGDLGSIGEVAGSEIRSEDVTEQLVDVESRVATQKASVERLRALIERAGTTSEIAEIESELTKRLLELESLQRRNASLQDDVAMATLTVEVRTTPIAPPEEEQVGFLGAVQGGWNALVAVTRIVLIGLGAMLPFLVALGLPAAGVVYLLRRRRRVTRMNEAG